MTPQMVADVEIAESCGGDVTELVASLGSFTIFDLNRVGALVSEMARANETSLYPMFLTMPSSRTVIEIGEYAMLVTAVGQQVEIVSFSDKIIEIAGSALRHRASSALQMWLSSASTAASTMDDKFVNLLTTNAPAATVYRRSVGELYHVTGGDDRGEDVLPLMCSCAFDLIAQQKLFSAETVSAPRAFRRRLQRIGAPPPPQHKRVDFCRTESARRASSDEPAFRKALHFVSGHWRAVDGPNSVLIDGKRRTWIDGHWRGNPALGIVTKTYVAGSKFLRPRGIAA